MFGFMTDSLGQGSYNKVVNRALEASLFCSLRWRCGTSYLSVILKSERSFCGRYCSNQSGSDMSSVKDWTRLA